VARFNNIPLTCGWQAFHVSEQVYVFVSPGSSWAAKVSDVTFAPPKL